MGKGVFLTGMRLLREEDGKCFTYWKDEAPGLMSFFASVGNFWKRVV